MDITIIITKACAGAVAGVTYGLTGYAKSKGEKVDWLKLSKTVVIGGCVGAVSEIFDMPMDEVQTFMVTFGATALIENGLKAIYRRIIKKD